MSLLSLLKSLQLERFAATFAENEVDLEAARLLSESDLEKLGIPLGPRKKLLRAFAELASPAIIAAHSEEAIQGAERRQLTILFCDLVGSTQLSQSLDPERLRELMQSYQQACRGVIEKYDGHVAQYLGDGLMVYFGWPRAHEDDAERAVRSALEIVGVVGELPSPSERRAGDEGKIPLSLQVRIGIATGPVVVGETGAGDASVPKLAVGETPNLAARLQGLADPGQIVIGTSTHRLLGATFEFLDLGRHTLKGILEPVPAYRVIGVGRAASRFEAVHGDAERLTPMIGRESEINLLLDRWEQARNGEGQAVLLSGEPGIGKSRIARALREKADEVPHQRLRFQCSPYHTSAALYPVIDQLERASGFTREDSPANKLDRLEALWRDSGTARPEGLALMATLLALPTDRYPVLAYAAHKQKEKTFQAMLAWISTGNNSPNKVGHGAILV